MTLLGMDLDSVGTGGVCMRISLFNMDRQYVVLALIIQQKKFLHEKKWDCHHLIGSRGQAKIRRSRHCTLKLKRYRPAKIK